MSFKTSLPAVDYYTQFDPYVFSVDNRPLVNLHDRDDAIADELDKRLQLVDITGDASPTANQLPDTWTFTRNDVGDYTITHNYNSTGYSVVGTIFNATTPHVFYVYNIGLNSFSLKTVTLASAAADIRFACIVSKF